MLILVCLVLFRALRSTGICPARALSSPLAVYRVINNTVPPGVESKLMSTDCELWSRLLSKPAGTLSVANWMIVVDCHSLMSDFEVELINDSVREFHVTFHGPTETLYSGGVWKIHVELPEQYPYKSPSIGFLNKILHPNIDEMSGSVCLDVINQTWSPMFDMVNIFEVFLPQLLRYPNVQDPLNADAAHLMQREPAAYESKVKDYVKRYASGSSAANQDKLKENAEEEEEEEEEEHVMSDVSLSDEDGEGDMDL